MKNNNKNDNNNIQDNSIHQPADKLFKTWMADIRVAKDIFHMCLPKAILETIDFNYLTLSPQSHITHRHKNRNVDVLYETKINGKDGYLYILTEHQSEPDRFMPLRLMEYVILIIRHHLKQHKNCDTFPVIYPLVFYTGNKPYSHTMDFYDCFGNP